MSTKIFKLIFSEAVTDYNGESARIAKVRVADPRLAAARRNSLARKLNRRFAGHARFVLDGAADSLVFVGKSAEIPFLGLAESNYGGNAFVNLDRKASDELLFEVASHETGHLLGLLRHDGVGLAACAYIAGETVTLNSGDSLTGQAIADETLYTVTEPYAKTLTVNAGATVSGTEICRGGTITVAGVAALSDITVARGTLTVNAGATIDNLTYSAGTITVKAAATFNNVSITGGDKVTLGSASIVNGATITAQRLTVAGAGGIARNINTAIAGGFGWGSGVYVAGKNTNIVLGGISNEANIKIENGVLTGNITGTGAAARGIGDDITVSDFILNNPNVSMFISGTGIKVSGVTVSKGVIRVTGGDAVFFGGLTIEGGAVSAYNGSIVSGATMTGGALTIAGAGATASNLNVTGTGKFTMGRSTYIAGGSTNIVQGGFASYADAKVEDGVITGLSFYDGVDFGIGDGITLQDAVIGNNVNSNSLLVSGSGIKISGGTLMSKSYLRISAAEDTLVRGMTVSGMISAANNSVTFDGLTLAGGLDTTGDASFIDLEVTGGWVSATGKNLFDGATVNGGTITATGGATFRAFEMTDGVVSAFGGGIVSGATITGGTMTVAGAGGIASDLNVTGNGKFGWGNGVYLAGSGTEIDLGAITNQSAVKVENGVITGLDIDAAVSRGIGDGITLKDAVIGNGTVIAGVLVSGTDVKVSGGTVASNSYLKVVEATDVLVNGLTVSGTIYASNGGVTFDNLNIAGGTVSATGGETFANLELNTGVISATGNSLISGATVNGGTISATGDASFAELELNAGTVSAAANNLFSGATVNGGTISAMGGATFRELEITGGKVSAYGGGKVYGATMTAGSMAVAGAGGIASGVNITGTGKLTMGRSTYLAGSNTNIVQGGLAQYADAKAESGVITGLNFNAGVDFGIGDGITVEDAVIGNAVSSNSLLVSGADIKISGGTLMSKSYLRISAAEDVLVNGLTVSGGIYASLGGVTFDNLKVTGGSVAARGGEKFTNLDFASGEIVIAGDNALISGAAVSGGSMTVSAGIVTSMTQTAGSVFVSTGAEVESSLLAGGSMVVNAGGNITDFGQTGGRVIVRGTDAVASGVTVRGGNMSIGNGGALNDATISGGTVVVRHVSGWVYDDIKSATASDVRIETDAELSLESGGILQAGKLADGATLTIYKGGKAGLTSAAAGATIDISFWDINGGHGNTDAIITAWGDFSADAKINVYNTESAYSYKIADTANANATLYMANTAWGVYGNAAVKSGDIFANAFTGKSYDFSDGTTLSFGSVTVDTKTGDASALTGDDAIAGGRAVKWDSATGVTSGNVFLAGDMTSGQAWVELDGYEGGANTTLYGAQGNSFATGTVNIYAKSGSLRNLAAGANAGGTVAAVNLTVAGAELDGTGYAGGFGNVTGKTATLISTGTFAKDFYAGALANKLTTTTSVGDVSMTIDGGEFSGNIYGASAVKTDTTKGNGTRHTAGDVTLTITDGETTQGKQACIFAGGYATGNATGTVYTVDSVTATISGGSWGEAAGGRGVFGGIMASGVEAQILGDVNITISGDATMGNVYGGGWAQKSGAKSIVGDVSINIAGGTITNVFGGGSHSTSGGTTEAGNVIITVSGGDITGAIYARGQSDGDTTGTASVIFTGAEDFGCDVFGYSYVGGAASDAALSFTSYTGEFSGDIGGFDSITLAGATAMTLATAATDVSNGKWEFDFTGRASSLAGTSLLTWSGADFENNSIKVSFADDTQAQGGWNIAAVAEAFSGTTFEVEIGGAEIATGLAYNQQIASGDYTGWGFNLESGVLKFKQLA